MNLTGQEVYTQKKRKKQPKKSERESEWVHVGTDKEYQAWCRSQPSALSGIPSNIVYAHYRGAFNSGMGTKPPYSGIPLTFVEHLEQHHEEQCQWMPKRWWEEQIIAHLARWKASKLANNENKKYIYEIR